MKARLIRNADQRLVLLCGDGTIMTANDLALYELLTDFRRNDRFVNGTKGRWDTAYPDISVYPGETVAFIADNDSLVVYDFKPFMSLLNAKLEMRGYISSAEFAERHDKSMEIIKVYCRTGRIPGAVKVGRAWLIPENAEYPVAPEQQKAGPYKYRSRKKHSSTESGTK